MNESPPFIRVPPTPPPGMQAVFFGDNMVLVPDDRMFLVPYLKEAIAHGKKVLITKSDYQAGPSGIMSTRATRGYYHEIVLRDHTGKVTDRLDWKSCLVIVQIQK